MKYQVYILSLLLIILWIVAYFVFHYEGIVHILLVIAGFAIIVRKIQGPEPDKGIER